MKQDKIVHLLQQLNRKIDKMAIDFTKLIADVTEQNTVVGSIVTLLTTFAADLKKALADLADARAAGDAAAEAAAQAQVDAAVSQIEANTAALAKAVVDNTQPASAPVEPAPVEPDPEVPAAA